jgi:hypothetical protein
VCVIVALVVGFGIGMWFQAKRSAQRASSEIALTCWQAHEAARRVADTAAETRRQMLLRAEQQEENQ